MLPSSLAPAPALITFFDAVLSIVLITGVALPLLLRFVEGARFPRTNLTVSLLVPFFLGPIVNIPRRLNEAKAAAIQRAQNEKAFAAVVALLKAQPGQAMCEEPMFCYEAGKPKVFDAFNVGELPKTGHLNETALFQMLDNHEVGAIQLNWATSDPIRPSKPRYSRFSDAFVRKLFTTYRPAIQTSNALIFIPVK